MTEIDLVEVSAVATPANSEARTLSIKSLDEHAAFREALIEALAQADTMTSPTKSVAEYRDELERVTKDIGSRPPVQIATFRC